MKKAICSMIFYVLLALMLLRGIIDPQSVAVNFAVVWALFGSVICIAASVYGIVTCEMTGSKSIEITRKNAEDIKNVITIFCRELSPLRRFCSLMLFAATFACLVGAGWIMTALLYVICVLIFTSVRSVVRQRIRAVVQ
ncbi:DNZ54_00345 family protein [Citrobacter sp. C348]|uniref:DNZ54_00345 family protein n=1 Tax=unclassified Citrobacter TaxID=2644389 RepID=UPI0010CA65AB|nr:DNZ54_00345 family protein [Citrobacter sp. wls711]TKU56813.1 lysA protein [Citrobacter sp. wls711]HEF0082689.1 lysA protein [Citrobacter braakii]